MVVLNIPVPLMLGAATCDGWANLGMPAGILLVAVVGYVLCNSYPIPMRNLSRGSIVVAISQLMPLLHIYVGSFAVRLCSGFDGDGNLDGWLQVTLATIITGLGLILPSLAFGYIFAVIAKSLRQ